MRAEHRVTEKNGALKWFDQEQWRFDQEKHGFHHEKWLLEDLNPGKNAERDGCKAISCDILDKFGDDITGHDGNGMATTLIHYPQNTCGSSMNIF
jgi:hypothetical protein